MVKPGYRTSEFWFTMVSFIFSGLYLMGAIGENSQKEDLIQETTRGLEATILIIGQLTVLFKYINSRAELKKTWWSTANPEERKVANRANSRKKKKPKSATGKTNAKPDSPITDK